MHDDRFRVTRVWDRKIKNNPAPTRVGAGLFSTYRRTTSRLVGISQYGATTTGVTMPLIGSAVDLVGIGLADFGAGAASGGAPLPAGTPITPPPLLPQPQPLLP